MGIKKFTSRNAQSPYLLVIESNPAIQQILQWSLMARYRGSITNTIEETSPFWRASFDRPDGIILDLDLDTQAWKDPQAFVLRFEARWREIFLRVPPLLLLTTQPRIAKILRQQGYSTLVKPFLLKELHFHVRLMIGDTPLPLHQSAY